MSFFFFTQVISCVKRIIHLPLTPRIALDGKFNTVGIFNRSIFRNSSYLQNSIQLKN